MRRALPLALLATGIAFGPAAVAADKFGPEFSAEAVQFNPKTNQSMVAKMFAGKDGMRRIEYTQDNRTAVQIAIPTQGTVYMLFPEQQSYMERQGPPMGTEDDDKPCANMANVTCKSLGTETIDGRAAEKWEFVSSFQGQTARTLQWVDQQRKFPLRQEMSNGQVMEMHLLGEEKLQGRSTEKWEMVSKSGQGEPVRSLQWYDPELRTAIREEQPGGFVQELRNIQVGAQAATLFQVPQGFRKVEPQAPQGGAPGGMQGQPRQ